MSDMLGNDDFWMGFAIQEAKKAEADNEVPIGAVVVIDNNIIAAGRNQSVTLNDPCAHAEIQALRSAGDVLQNYRLIGSTLFVTVEPCIMCLGAMVHARIDRLVYGCADPKTGAVDTHFNLLGHSALNHRFDVAGNVLSDECASILSAFFRKRRIEKANQKVIEQVVVK